MHSVALDWTGLGWAGLIGGWQLCRAHGIWLRQMGESSSDKVPRDCGCRRRLLLGVAPGAGWLRLTGQYPPSQLKSDIGRGRVVACHHLTNSLVCTAAQHASQWALCQP